MHDLNRRDAMKLVAAGTPMAAFGALRADDANDALPLDRQAVLAAGMTEAEADCWELTGDLAGKMLNLPSDHPMEEHEVAHELHAIQNRLLARVTYRRYLAHAKRLHGEAPDEK
jgi:hypothetical protein